MEEQNNQAAEMEQQAPVAAPQEETTPSFSILSDDEVAAIQQPQQTYSEPEPQAQEQEITSEPQDAQPEAQQEYASEEIEGAVLQFLSERLGRSISSLDDLQAQQTQEQRELDERISVIADFVEKTGRDPRDWFIYQQLNPSEMDDLTAIQVQMTSDYPNLSQEEISLLASSKYKLDPDLHSEEEVKLSQLQLKIDAENARKGIDEMRLQYQSPERQESDNSSGIDEEWISNMRNDLNAMEAIEFDLGNGKSFTFGMDESYKNQLAEKNARLDEFFDPYVREDGSWDYDMLNMHRTMIDNMDQVVQSVYRQGLSDGQRGIVEKAANVTPTSPNQGNQPQPGPDALTQQLREALMGDTGMKFLS